MTHLTGVVHLTDGTWRAVCETCPWKGERRTSAIDAGGDAKAHKEQTAREEEA